MPRRTITNALRRLVYERAQGCCEYCYAQVSYSPDPFNVEHIVPRTVGGETNPNNLALACFGCNNAKGIHMTAVDPITQTLVPLYHPRQNKWTDHFQWNATYTHVIGISPVGRATMALLQLNRDGLVNLRRVLHSVNAHPPVLKTN